MSMRLRESRRNNRRQRRGRFFRGLLVVASLCGLGVIAYLVGNNLAQREVSRLRAANVQLNERLADQSQHGNRLQTLADTAQSRERKWRLRYDQEVPTGAIKALVTKIQGHLVSGADPQRLELFIDAGARPPVCDNAPTTKRFLVRTPQYAGANDSVSFVDNALTVTAQGEPMANADGNPEAWFDAAKPVSLEVAAIGGGRSEITGLLPLHHAVIWGGAEYRFSVVNGNDRGFVLVTADRCTIRPAN